MQYRVRRSLLTSCVTLAGPWGVPLLWAQAATVGAPATSAPPPSIAFPSATSGAAASSYAGAELPAFTPGYWQYERTIVATGNPRPQKTSVKKCSNPSNEIRQKLSDLQHKGCEFTPRTQQGNRYVSSWKCKSAEGALIAHSVVTVKSETSYQDDSEVRNGERLVHARVVATRISDCPIAEAGKSARSSGAQLHQPDQH